MTSLFLSHSHRDNRSATRLADWLRAQGHVSYYLDIDPERGTEAGKRWEAELYRQLRMCRAVIAVLTPNWLASRWCFAEVVQARAAGKPVVFAKITQCRSPAVFRDVQHVNLVKAGDDGYRSLARALRSIGISPLDAFDWDPGRPPFPGLLAFEEADAAVFFGRDADIQQGLELLDSLRRTGGASFVLCLGASGSGKSSLLRAGLLPRLRKDRQAWLPVAPFRPHLNPLEELAMALARAFAAAGKRRDWRSLYKRLSVTGPGRLSQGGGLTEIARDLCVASAEPDATVLVAIDQAEELFGHVEATRTQAFTQCLRGALENDARRVMAIATIRSDALVAFQTHPVLRDFPFRPLPVAPIPVRDLPKVIEGPGRLAEIEFETGLVPTLVQDAATSDALPLLAFALRELYERYGEQHRIRNADYEQLGRLEGAVSGRADAILRALSPSNEELRALREAVAPALVRVGENGRLVRRRALLKDIPKPAHRVLGGFVEGRLLVASSQGSEPTIELAHEALLHAWPPLRRWLERDTQRLRTFYTLRAAAEQWDANSREDGWLVHHGERLQAVEDLVRVRRFADQLGLVDNAYIAACREFSARQGAERRERLAAVSRWQTDLGLATLGMLLALEALETDPGTDRPPSPNVESALLRGIFAQREELVLCGHSDAVNKAAVSPDGSLLGTASRDTTVRLWKLSTGECTHVLKGHAGQVYDLAFSPDGRWLATGSSDRTARLWSTAAGTAMSVLSGHADQVYRVGFSADGGRLLTGSGDGRARLWRVGVMGIDGPPLDLNGHTDSVMHVTFSPDGARILTTSADGTGRVWDAATGITTAVLTGHAWAVCNGAFSPCGRKIVTGSWDHTARLWDAETGQELAVLTGHRSGVSVAAFSPDGAFAATASADGTVRMWDAGTMAPVAVLRGHKGQLYDAQFSADGRWLVTAGDDGTTRLWDCASNESADIFRGHVARVWTATFTPDGRRVVTASEDNTARIWIVAPNSNVLELRGHAGPVLRVLFAPHGRWLVTVSSDRTATIWDSETGGQRRVLDGHEAGLWHATISADGSRIATTSDDGTTRIWDAESGCCVHVLHGHEGRVRHAHFAPDGRRLITGGSEGAARLWDTESGKVVAILAGHGGPIDFTEISRDGSRIVTGSEDGTARLWSAIDGAPRARLEGHRGRIVNGAFAADSGRLVTASWDRTARLWDCDGGTPLSVLRGHTDAVLSAVFSPDGGMVATASSDNTGRVFDATSGKSLVVLQGHGGEVNEVSFSADGRLLLTASADDTARLWHPASGLLVATLIGHAGAVTAAAFSPEGRRVVTASTDGTARLWRLPVGTGDDWAAYARRAVPRDLSDDERSLYLQD